MKQIKYKETQYGILLNVVLAISILFSFFTYSKVINESGAVILLIVIFLIIILWLLLYKITIIITDDVISAIFGIGLLKKEIPLKEIDFSTLEVVKPSMLTGIGIRYTTKGWLWNVKFGKAIYFKTKTGKTFFVGTDEADKIRDLLLKFKN